MDQEMRIKMIEEDSKRGDILQSVMDKEAFLATTEAGSAFESLFQLLCDQNRSTELREQLHYILSEPVAEYLVPTQQKFLKQLMRELSRESDRVR